MAEQVARKKYKHAPVQRCKCGCGQMGQGQYRRGHRPEIRPVGMSMERAEQIAGDVLARNPELCWLQPSRATASDFFGDATRVINGDDYRVNSGRPVGKPLTVEQRTRVEGMIRAGYSNNEVAMRTGVSSRTVARIVAAARKSEFESFAAQDKARRFVAVQEHNRKKTA